MEVIFDLIVRNIPDVPMSRERLRERLKDKAEENDLSDVLMCHVVEGRPGEAAHAFLSLKDLFDNEEVLDWSGMRFFGARLTFEVNRTTLLGWDGVQWRLDEERRRRHRAPSEPRLEVDDGYTEVVAEDPQTAGGTAEPTEQDGEGTAEENGDEARNGSGREEATRALS
jgi:hypothetical protein